jgi:hypothetical protein
VSKGNTKWWSNGIQNRVFISGGKQVLRSYFQALQKLVDFPFHVNTKFFSHTVLKRSPNPTAIAGMLFQHATSFCH